MVRVNSVDFISHLLIKAFSQPPIEDAVYGATLLIKGPFAQRGTEGLNEKKKQ